MPLILAAPAALAVASIDAYRNHARLLIVFAPTAADAALAQQQQSADVAAFAARDVRIVEVVGDTVKGATDAAATLRRRFGVDAAGFRLILVGKDGHVALDSATPVPAARIDATIDAMPMRQQEMRRRR